MNYGSGKLVPGYHPPPPFHPQLDFLVVGPETEFLPTSTSLGLIARGSVHPIDI